MTTETRLAGDVVPDPIEARYGKGEAKSDGLAADMAAYHAARAQGFYLAATNGDMSPHTVTSLLNEYHLSALYWHLACTDEASGDSIAASIGLELRHQPEGIGSGIFDILEWANVDPESIRPFKVAA